MVATVSKCISPYGGSLVSLLVNSEGREDLKNYAGRLPSLQLSDRSVCDLELLANGSFSPLAGFMGKSDYQCVLNESRLANGQLFPMPITLPVGNESAIKLDSDIALRDGKNELLGVMTVEEVYEWDLVELSQNVFGTQDLRHPLVAEMHGWGKYNISGRLKIFQLPGHHDFRELRLTPAETRAALGVFARKNVIAFQTDDALHRAHEEMTKCAIKERDGVLFLHPIVGLTKLGDIDHYTRVRTYKALSEKYYRQGRILLALLPLATRMAGPREALWHALIRRNYGANCVIIGRNYASPGLNSNGEPFYGAHDAQELVRKHSAELGVEVIQSQEPVYLSGEGKYKEVSAVRSQVETISLSGTQVREIYLNRGEKLPAWFARPEVSEILADIYPPRYRQGVCIWFTGLSGSGKSTTAEILTALLLERGRQATVLDGDVVRTHLSKGLGFNKEDRDINVRRIGYVASEIVRHGGVVICAAISPYRATRNDVRNMIGPEHFFEIYVNTPIEVCEQRDVKGMYAKARRGEVTNFTGIDDAYEQPSNPEITLDTVGASPEVNARLIVNLLIERGFVRTDSNGRAKR